MRMCGSMSLQQLICVTVLAGSRRTWVGQRHTRAALVCMLSARMTLYHVRGRGALN